jgi:hypothetical protein
MAISVIGGTSGGSAASGNVGGLNVVVAGWSSSGYYNLPSPRRTRYALSHQDDTNSRVVFDFGGAGNAVSTNYLVQNGSTLGGTFNSVNLTTDPVNVAVYSQWARRPLPANANGGVGYLNGTYFVGNSSGNIYSSADLSTWTLRGTPVAATPRGFAFGNSTYVAVGYSGGTGMNATSTDGVTWTNRSTGNLFTDVAFGAGRFFATVSSGVNGFYSTDGFTWTATTIGQSCLQVKHNGLAVGSGSLFVATGPTGILYSSPDGITWTNRGQPTGGPLNSVAYGDGMWVAVGGTGFVASSPDGITWTSRSITGTSNLNFNAVAYGNGRFFANADYINGAGGYGGGWVSTNGIAWRPAGAISNNGFPPSDMGALKFGGGTFFATAQSNYVAVSSDGLQGGGAGFTLLANAAPLIN